jgi:hypothetical protein
MRKQPMREPPEPPYNRKKSDHGWGCLAFCLGLPLLAALGIGALIQIHNRPPDIVVPTPKMPPNNAYDDFVKAGKMEKAVVHQTPISMSKPTFSYKEFADGARDAAPALAIMRQALNKPYLHPPVRSNWDNSSQNNSLFRELARELAGEAYCYDMDGKYARAADSRLDAMEMGVTIPRGGPLLAEMVGEACESIGASQFETSLPKLSSAELAHVAARLDRIAAKRVPFADVLTEAGNSEDAFDLEWMRQPGKEGLTNLNSIRSLVAEDYKSLTWSDRRKIASFYLADKGAILRENQAYCRALAEEARQPYTGKSKVPVPHNPLAEMRGYLYTTIHSKFVSMEAVTAILRTEVAVYRYRAAYGKFPESLSALVPAYLKALPDDPCAGSAGKPLRYRVTDGGKSFLLYSLGPDLTDNGGTPERYVGYGPGDIVAGRMWKRKSYHK